MNGKALLVLVAFATSAMLIGGGSTGLASPLATNSTGNGNGNNSSSGGLTTTNTDGGEANTIDAGSTATDGGGTTSGVSICPIGAPYADTYTTVNISAFGGLKEHRAKSSWFRNGSSAENATRHVVESDLTASGGWNATQPGDPAGNFYTRSCRQISGAAVIKINRFNVPVNPVDPDYATYGNTTTYPYYSSDESQHPTSVEHSRCAATETLGAVRARKADHWLYITAPGEFDTAATAASVPLNAANATAPGIVKGILLGTHKFRIGSAAALPGSQISLVVKTQKTWHTLAKIYNFRREVWDDVTERWIWQNDGARFYWNAQSSVHYDRKDVNIQKILCEDISVDTRKGFNTSLTKEPDPNAEYGFYNFGTSSYKGGLFVGYMDPNGRDRSGLALIQLYPGTPATGSGWTSLAAILSCVYLGKGVGADGNVDVTLGIPRATDPYLTKPWQDVSYPHRWQAFELYETLPFTSFSPETAIGEYYNWVVPLTNPRWSTGLMLMMTNQAFSSSWRYFASKEYQAGATVFPHNDSQPRIWKMDRTGMSSW